jgi:cleavage stimulation factor subunit 3
MNYFLFFHIFLVMFAYEQSFLCLAYHPDIWFEAANFLNQESKILMKLNNDIEAKKLYIETEKLFDRAIDTFMKDNLLLYFAYADYEEVFLSIYEIKITI